MGKPATSSAKSKTIIYRVMITFDSPTGNWCILTCLPAIPGQGRPVGLLCAQAPYPAVSAVWQPVQQMEALSPGHFLPFAIGESSFAAFGCQARYGPVHQPGHGPVSTKLAAFLALQS